MNRISELRHGDLLKVFHFRDGRRKKHYMYKLVVDSEGGLQCVDVLSIAKYGVCAHKCTALALRSSDFEIIARGYDEDMALSNENHKKDGV